MIHESLFIRLQNILTEVGAAELLQQVRFSSMVTLIIELFFSHEAGGSYAHPAAIWSQKSSVC